jgi:murein DD-endopeptidase MepM/ murein hydrolase activator NlpD
MPAGLVPLVLAGLAMAASPRGQSAESLHITTAARSVQPGEVVVLTVVTPDTAETVRVRALGHDIPTFPVDAHTWRALIGIDLDVHPGRYEAVTDARGKAGTWHATTPLMVLARTFSTRKLRVDPIFVNPPREAETRIVQEARQLDALWSASSSSRLWDGAFVQPVPGGGTNRFGARSIFNGQPRSPHGGEDFPNPEGTPIVAPNGGMVVLARDLYFTGNTVVIDHGLGLFSLLAHLSVIEVAEGDHVRTGQRVGQVGSTGRVTGPHLHWAVRVAGARVDPLSLLASLGR